MKERFLYCFTWLSVFLLMPYLITCAMNGAETALLNKKFDMEMCIPLLTSLQISENYEKEAVKAQTIIARTNFYYELKERHFLEIVKDIRDNICVEEDDFVDKVLKFYSYPHKIYLDASLHTMGDVLTHENEIKLIPYHLCSGGATRDGEEVFHSVEYSYLKSVESGFDKEFSDYIYVTYFSDDELSGEIEIGGRDQAGYVQSLNIDGKILEGETFRQGMNLPSSNFDINKTGKKYQVICRGIGHGVGFSQYGGNRLAEMGKSWEDILRIYFPEMNIVEKF